MGWTLCWSEPAQRTLLNLPWPDATRVDAQILRFAASGEGKITRLRDDDAVTVRLRVGRYGVRLSLDRIGGVMTVWSIYRLDGAPRS